MSVELKPCPFCGQPVTIYYSSAGGGYYAVHKDEKNSECFVLMPLLIDHLRIIRNIDEAYEVWNGRATE